MFFSHLFFMLGAIQRTQIPSNPLKKMFFFISNGKDHPTLQVGL